MEAATKDSTPRRGRQERPKHSGRRRTAPRTKFDSWLEDQTEPLEFLFDVDPLTGNECQKRTATVVAVDRYAVFLEFPVSHDAISHMSHRWVMKNNILSVGRIS